MASTIFFVNLKGEEVVSRHFRNDIPKQAIDAFRNEIVIAKATGQNPPVVRIEDTTFVYTRHGNLYVVAATKANPNIALIFEYLYQKIRILKSYLGEHFTDESLTSNFTLLYEIFVVALPSELIEKSLHGNRSRYLGAPHRLLHTTEGCLSAAFGVQKQPTSVMRHFHGLRFRCRLQR